MDHVAVSLVLSVGQLNHIMNALTHAPYKDAAPLIAYFQGEQQKAMAAERARLEALPLESNEPAKPLAEVA